MLIYFLIALIATVIGSLVGLGGGVIMKPLLQAVSPLDALSINILSSVTVFFMAMSTLYNRTKANPKLYKKSFGYLVVGSIIGGVIGNELFSEFLILFPNENIVSFIQTIILTVLLILVLFKHLYVSKLHVFSSNAALFTIGIMLSIVATFLGIGGGPINMMVCIGFLGVSILEATYLSILIIFFAQLSNLIVYLLSGTFLEIELLPLLVMIPTAIIGGIIGGNLSHKVSEKHIHLAFNVTISALILLNFYNLSQYI
ncbi:sulfite exporter TauE/SafE family protein [Mollicutes bacterium LVI A0039]|nr:sulfite exporter TauE/SafE family protein [Mollicutes bacterium LVI A0039]